MLTSGVCVWAYPRIQIINVHLRGCSMSPAMDNGLDGNHTSSTELSNLSGYTTPTLPFHYFCSFTAPYQKSHLQRGCAGVGGGQVGNERSIGKRCACTIANRTIALVCCHSQAVVEVPEPRNKRDILLKISSFRTPDFRKSYHTRINLKECRCYCPTLVQYNEGNVPLQHNWEYVRV